MACRVGGSDRTAAEAEVGGAGEEGVVREVGALAAAPDDARVGTFGGVLADGAGTADGGLGAWLGRSHVGTVGLSTVEPGCVEGPADGPRLIPLSLTNVDS